MTAAEVAANPFLTKENTLKFFKKGNLCGSDMTEIRILNQTNKALVFPSTLITHRGSDGSTAAGTTPLTTNADWKLISKEPSNVTTISNIVINNSTSVNTFPTATQTGYEQNNNAGKLVTLTYNVTMDLNKPRFNYLTFADATTPKRFADVRLAILQCPSGQQPSIEGWALIGGFTQAEIDAVKATGNDSRILTNGMQMHRQANSIRGVNQIFLSSNFGANPGDSDERWMIHNLDAIAYDGTTYTGGDPIALSQGKLTGPNGNFSYVRAFWCYPGDRTTPTFYNQNQRLGLLYNWDAATAGKGGSDGKGNVDNTTSGGTEANNEVQFPEGSGVAQQKRRQGICPKGWHLPSAREWFKLEDVTIGENSIVFSNQINAIPYMTGNGGLVWKEPCEPSSDVTTQGTSNGISPVTRPGLDLLLAGYTIGYDVRYGEFAFLWSSSSVDDLTSWNRGVAAKHQFAYFNSNIRDIQGSVRCKKD